MIIKINEIQLFGYHGLYEEEKENGQNFIISLSIDINYIDKDDKIENTIDYTKILNEVRETFNQKRYNLIESLAVAISNNLMRNKKIESLDLSIKKESPPIDAKLNSVEVNLRKTR
tara:strand:+ start:73 stop:420 length:348 start_codon:yes stop_codon:yes gene_type:complete